MGKRALVVGAGVGGLGVAIGLRDAGWEVTVVERWPEVVAVGAGLGVWPDAQRALLGLGVDITECSVRAGAASLWRFDGRRLAAVPTGQVERREGMPVRIVARPVLMDLLLQKCEGIEVRTGTDVRDVPGLVSGADVVIGADGVGSAVRQEEFGEIPLRYTGCVAWRAQIDGELPSYGETWGPRALVGVTPLQAGATNVYLAVRTPADRREQWSDVRPRFDSWHPLVREALSRVDGDSVLRHPLNDLPPLPSFTSGTTALVGDSAHAMAPSLGRGACEAMLDAAALVSALTHERDVATALQTYDSQRRRPALRTVARSRLMLRVATATRWTAPRNALVRGAGLLLS